MPAHRPGSLQHAALRRVLAATDLSSRSDRALRRAAMLAQAAGAELLVVHAIDDDQPRSLVEAERREALAVLRDQVAALPELSAGAASLLIEEGDPFEAILHVADAKEVDLIALGEHRRRALRDIFSGTTVERVMRHGHLPVLMVNQPPSGAYRHALAATDFSEHSARAIRTAIRLGLLGQARLTVLHAFEPPGMGALALADAPAATVAAHEAEAARAASSALTDFVAGLRLSTPPEQRTAMGRPATVVKEFAARLRPDLLIVGTAGAGFLRRAVMGSTAAEVLGAVPCDALAVPPPEAR
ncbi:universal stress protein [Falsiroseomonas oryziterrae]|uniref:universal stress protein n=1 Tax=Falsiroseomonas oryziterrae TaxID=2911368 RepID=UPI001F18F934|nr:universal stress protein [Roseomonas sp. NPKOSM-4]